MWTLLSEWRASRASARSISFMGRCAWAAALAAWRNTCLTPRVELGRSAAAIILAKQQQCGGAQYLGARRRAWPWRAPHGSVGQAPAPAGDPNRVIKRRWVRSSQARVCVRAASAVASSSTGTAVTMCRTNARGDQCQPFSADRLEPRTGAAPTSGAVRGARHSPATG